jgi:predicted permease
MLLSACLLSLRGLQQTLTMPLGFDARGVTVAGFDLGLAGYSEEDGLRLQQRLRDAVAQLPGVRAAAYSNSIPLSIDQSSTAVTPDDRVADPSGAVSGISRYEVSPGFFRVLGVRLLAGREFESRDAATSPRVAIVNATFARTVLKTADPVGRRFYYGWGAEGGNPAAMIQVVGLVEDGKYESLNERPRPAVFDPILQAYNATTTLFVRSDRPEAQMVPDMRRAIAVIDPSLVLYETGSLDRLLAFARLPSRAAAVALSAFGLLAILLAATGIHGIVAYAVAQRQRELGIRIAVGAGRGHVLRLVLSRIAGLIAVGSAAGLLLALAAARLLTAIVYEASPRDPIVLAGVCALMAGVGLAACWGPARRSLRIDPVTALRAE